MVEAAGAYFRAVVAEACRAEVVGAQEQLDRVQEAVAEGRRILRWMVLGEDHRILHWVDPEEADHRILHSMVPEAVEDLCLPAVASRVRRPGRRGRGLAGWR